jgi:D-glycero-alpha-D-manno-heptose 1-phosphate guanylyltransferase
MAPINDIPFLDYQLNYLITQGISEVFLSIGHQSEVIKQHYGNQYQSLQIHYVEEPEPLGTGGAIRLAFKKIDTQSLLVLNGDTMFPININDLVAFHQTKKADCTIALKPLKNFERYGAVEANEEDRITAFHEKKLVASGKINAGVYLLNGNVFMKHCAQEKFSIEKDFFEAKVNELDFYGFSTDTYFIDIGIPEDYQKAQKELPEMFNEDASAKLSMTNQNDASSGGEKSVFAIFREWKVDKSWTLFLDRDGVINERIVDGYVKNVEEFIFNEGVVETIKKLSAVVGRIVVVTNQQGIGKGLMTTDDLNKVHDFMLSEIERAGGRIDNIYFAPGLASPTNELRKPNIGMAIQAKKDFPEINFSKSVMIGDSPSDMAFGKNAGMKTIFVGKENDLADEVIDSLKL